MIKADLLKQASNNTFDDLFIDNKPKTEPIIQTKVENTEKEGSIQKTWRTKTEEVKEIDNKPTMKEIVKSMTPPKKMLAFRIPNTTIDNLEKYSYITRLTKQDLITMSLDNFFNSKEGKEIIKEFDKIQK